MNDEQAAVSGQLKHRTKWIGERIRGSLWPRFEGHPTITQLHCTRAMLVNTTAWCDTDSAGPPSSGGA